MFAIFFYFRDTLDFCFTLLSTKFLEVSILEHRLDHRLRTTLNFEPHFNANTDLFNILTSSAVRLDCSWRLSDSPDFWYFWYKNDNLLISSREKYIEFDHVDGNFTGHYACQVRSERRFRRRSKKLFIKVNNVCAVV